VQVGASGRLEKRGILKRQVWLEMCAWLIFGEAGFELDRDSGAASGELGPGLESSSSFSTLPIIGSNNLRWASLAFDHVDFQYHLHVSILITEVASQGVHIGRICHELASGLTGMQS
jgi:hypothetical protein